MGEERDGGLWVSTLNQRTGEASLVRVHNLKVAEIFPSGEATDKQFFNAIAAHPQGGLWVGGEKHGVYWFRNGQYTPLDLGEYKGEMDALLPESDGSLWVTTRKGFFG